MDLQVPTWGSLDGHVLEKAIIPLGHVKLIEKVVPREISTSPVNSKADLWQTPLTLLKGQLCHVHWAWAGSGAYTHDDYVGTGDYCRNAI